MASFFRRLSATAAPPRARGGRPPKVRLQAEALEDRAVPATFLVTTDKDSVDANSGFLSLRQAIIATNAQPGNNTIQISPNIHDINLVNGELLITNPVTIQGAGAGQLEIVQSAKGSRVFDIQTGLSQLPITVKIIGVTVTGGNGTSGAGVYNNGADVTLIGDHITANNSNGFNGAGVLSDTRISGSLSIINTTIDSNNSNGGSGAGVQIAGPALIQNSTITNNNAGNGAGGGVNAFSSSTSTIENSTVAFNTARTGGGLNVQNGASVTLVSTILSNNTSNDLAGNPTASSTNNLVNTVAPGVSSIVNGTNANLVGVGFNANLQPLALAAGSQVPTLALGPGSAAIDAGANPANLAADQIGQPRQIGGAPDIGAVEAPQTVANTGGSSSSSGSSQSQDPGLLARNAALVQSIVLFVLGAPHSGIQLLSLADLNGDGFQDIVLTVGTGRQRTIIALNGLTAQALFTIPAPVA